MIYAGNRARVREPDKERRVFAERHPQAPSPSGMQSSLRPLEALSGETELALNGKSRNPGDFRLGRLAGL